jgi:hypothetical protein
MGGLARGSTPPYNLDCGVVPDEDGSDCCETRMEYAGHANRNNPIVILAKFIARYLLFSITVVPLAITAPLWLPVLLVGLLTEVVFIPSEWLFQSRMKAKGRYLSPRRLASRLAANDSGTLIVDAPTPSWGITRVWWTQEDVLSSAPVPSAEDRDRPMRLEDFSWRPFDRWCWHHYLSPEKGQGTLIASWHGQKLAKALAEKYPQVILLDCFSAGRFLDKNERPKTKSVTEDAGPLWDREIDLV